MLLAIRFQTFQSSINRKRCRFLPWWIRFECLEVLRDIGLRADQNKGTVKIPIPISVGRDSGLLVRIRAQVEQPRNTCKRVRLTSDIESSFRTLLREYEFPIVVT